VRSEVSEESTGRRPEAEGQATGIGRVVVEIKQPPRRGRGARRGGTRSAGVEHDDHEETTPVAAAAPAPPAAAPAAAAPAAPAAPAPATDTSTE
jgi:hypothetical protein